MTIDERKFRVALAEKGIPQWRLAVQAGLSPPVLSAIKLGRRSPTSEQVARIERALGLPLGALATAQ